MNIIPRPQVQVVQSFVPSPVANLAAQPAYVFGPQYQLMYFDDPSIKADLQVGTYDPATANTFNYAQLDSRGTVDLDSVRVFMEDVLARYVTLPDDPEAPLFVVSDRDKHKVRAAPYVAEALEAKSGPTTQEVAANGVFLQAGGCINRSPALPTNYYIWPAQLSILNQFNNEPAQDAVLRYSTAEGLSGDLSVLATGNPLTSGSTVAGPHGMVLDLDAIDQDNNAHTRVAARLTYQASTDFTGGAITVNGGAPVNYAPGANHRATVDALAVALADVADVIHVHGANADTGALWIIGSSNTLTTVTQAGAATPPSLTAVLAFNAFIPARTLTFRNSAGTASFTVTVKDTALRTLMDLSVSDGQTPLVATVTDSGSADVTWDSTSGELDVEFDAGTTTLTAIRDLLLGAANADLTFDVSDISGSGTAAVDQVVDQWGTPVWHGEVLPIVRDVYRIQVEASPYVFQSGNGVAVSSHFKSRGVRVGDVVQYSYLDPNGDTVQGQAAVAGFVADRLAASHSQPTLNASNRGDIAPSTITPNQGLDSVVAGGDNQRRFDGQATKVYALGSQVEDFEYAGDLPRGSLSETFTFRVTTGGIPGITRGTVTGSSGYYREDARVLRSPDGDANKAVVYIGRNLWVTFELGTTDGDFRFQAGDWFTITPPVTRRWTQVGTDRVSASGTYTGPSNTTYVLEVTRGGLFNRQHTVRAGVQTPDRAVISYTGQPDTGPDDVVTIGGSSIDASDYLDGTPTATYTNLRNWINTLAENVTAELVPSTATPTTAGQLIVHGPADVVQTVALSAGYDNATITYAAVEITGDISGWSAGDIDTEYILRCTAGGALANSRFQLQSITGDTQSNIHFDDATSRFVGENGLQLTLTLVGSPTFRVGDEWVVSVQATRPQVTVRDTAGIDGTATVTVDSAQAFALGVYGLTAQFSANPNGGLVKGDQFYVQAMAERAGAYRTLVLESPVASGFVPCTLAGEGQFAPTTLALELHLRANQVEIDAPRRWSPPNYDWQATADDITIASNLRIQSSDWVNLNGSQDWIPVVAGDVYVQYRALLNHYTDGIYDLSNTDDVVTTLGRVHPDNPLAQGVYHALLNSAGRQVLYTAVETNDLDGYARVLALAEHSNQPYSLAPMTRDAQILDAVQAHINQMSDESVKQWRIGFFGSRVDKVTDVYSERTHGQLWLATVQDDPATADVQYTELSAAGATFLSDLRVGDTVRLKFSTDQWGNETWVTDTVAEIRSNETLVLAVGLPSSVDVPEKFEVWRTRTKADLVAAYEAHCGSYASRRVYCAVPNSLWSGTTQYGSEVAAAAVAGLVSAVAPQQPITNVELIGFDAVPDVLQTFTQNDLDRIASAGGMIIMQSARGGRVFIRHQVSTATLEGNVYTRELSITKNTDASCYLLAHQLDPYYGKYNITQTLLTVMQTQVKKMLGWLTSPASGGGLLGPMLLPDNTRFVSLQQHPTLKDHTVLEVDLDLPVPNNVIRLTAVIGDHPSIRAVNTGTDELIAGFDIINA